MSDKVIEPPGVAERRAFVESIARKYTTEHLRQWSAGILATSYEDAPGMVAEDASVLDIAAAYILKLEAKQEAAR